MKLAVAVLLLASVSVLALSSPRPAYAHRCEFFAAPDLAFASTSRTVQVGQTISYTVFGSDLANFSVTTLPGPVAATIAPTTIATGTDGVFFITGVAVGSQTFDITWAGIVTADNPSPTSGVCRLTVDVTAAGAPEVLDPALDVRTVVSGLNQPTGIVFLGVGDFFVGEKASGQIKRVTNGVVGSVVLDLAVNSGSERGLLDIALHPNFPTNPGVYVSWTESSTGVDTNVLSSTPLLGNRVDRFTWNGSALTFDQNITRHRALQAPFTAEPTPTAGRGNNDGGVIKFGPDGKLYIIIGDVGRRGQLQNLRFGPTTTSTTVPDDQFGGPAPDNAHLTGVILRLNADGTTPTDNPFFAHGAGVGGEAGANIQRLYAYGIRNSFGIDFNPVDGALWSPNKGDDAFDEIERVVPGHNSGWIQFMGPAARIGQYKAIEAAGGAAGLQQTRWPPANIANSSTEAMSRLFTLPGSTYSDPNLSWLWDVAPAAIGFMRGQGLGPDYAGDLFVGAGTTNLEGGYLYRFNMTSDGTDFAFTDSRLADRVADNVTKHEGTESESLRFGRNFGIATDIQTGPNGHLYVVSITNGAVYEIFRRAEPINASLALGGVTTSYNATDPRAAAGVFTITGTFTNSSVESFFDIYFQVTTLGGAGCPCMVLNADGGPGGVGARVSVPAAALTADGLLTPGEPLMQTFEIGLTARRPFTFFVDAFGVEAYMTPP